MGSLLQQDLDPTYVRQTIEDARNLETELTDVTLDDVTSNEMSRDAEESHGLTRARELLREHPWVLGVLPLSQRVVRPPEGWVWEFLRGRDEPEWHRRRDREIQLSWYIRRGKEALALYREGAAELTEKRRYAAMICAQLARGVSPEELCFSGDDELIELICTASKALTESTD